MSALLERLAEVEDRLAARGSIQADADARTIDEAARRIAELEAELAKAKQRCEIMTDTASRFEARSDRLSTQLTASHAECEGLRAALGTIAQLTGNVEHKGGGANAARMYGDMLNGIRGIARAAFSQKETGA